MSPSVTGSSLRYAAFMDLDASFLDVLAEGFILCDRIGRVVRCNPAASRILGLPERGSGGAFSCAAPWPATREDGSTLAHDDHPTMTTLRTGRPIRDFVMSVRPPDASQRWLSVNTLPIVDPHSGELEGVVAVFTDVTAYRQAEGAARKTEDMFRKILGDAPIGMAVVSLEGRFLRVNGALCDLLGYDLEELSCLGFRDITHPDDEADDVVNAALSREGTLSSYQTEKRFFRKDGSVVWVLLAASPLRHDDGTAQVIVQFADTSERKAAMSRLEHLSRRDALTGLLNRRALESDIAGLAYEARRLDTHVSIVMIDIDRFKHVNDRFGHEAGDRVLRDVADTVQRAVRKSDRVYRYGGEEFLIAFLGAEEEALTCTKRVRADVERSATTFRSERISLTISCGFATSHGEGDLSEVVRAADRALYRAKAAGRNRTERARVHGAIERRIIAASAPPHAS